MKEDAKKPGPKPKATLTMCRFRKTGVICARRNRLCGNCGWNPDVEAERKWLLAKGYMKSYLVIEPYILTTHGFNNAMKRAGLYDNQFEEDGE